ncbi:MAG TPA: hypothetical protein VGH44_03665 [Candidatus Saccharimonadia bacterium]|jgi:hypothetical protein
MSELQVTETTTRDETVTTEVLVEEGNVRVEIEGTEATKTPEHAPAVAALVETSPEQFTVAPSNLDMVEFKLPSNTKFEPTKLELLPPTTSPAVFSNPSAPTSHLSGEVAQAYSLENQLQRSRE